MKLNAKVTNITREVSGVVFGGDVEGGGWLFKLANTEGYVLDQELTLLVLTKQQASDLFDVLDGVEGERGLLPEPLLLRDQLRPDPLPPWEQPIDGKRLCCGHSDAVFNGRCTNTHMGQSDNMDVIVCGCRCITAEAGAHA